MLMFSEGVCVEASGKAQGCVVLLVECECADVGQGRAYYESREEFQSAAACRVKRCQDHTESAPAGYCVRGIGWAIKDMF